MRPRRKLAVVSICVTALLLIAGAATITLACVGGSRTSVLGLSNFPNPFNPTTTLSYTLPSRGHVTVVVYDVHGARVASLVDADKNAGNYSVRWNPGATVRSGVYFARIEHNGIAKTAKMVLLK